MIKAILPIIFFFQPLAADFNEPLPIVDDPQYLNEFAWFENTRDDLMNDPTLIAKIQAADIGKKLMIVDKKRNIIIKKRRNNHIHDAYAWELSYLLGGSEYVTPSFPVNLGGVLVIIQKLEKFEYGNYSKGTIEKVSLETYWKAHLLAYILGFSDLALANIGVNSKGIIRYFDNEASLIYYNTPFKTKLSFSTGFICQSFDWPQFNTPLDVLTASRLEAFIEDLNGFEETLETYSTLRGIEIPVDAIHYRLRILRNFNLSPGATFEDLYSEIFPELHSGLSELNIIVSSILKKNVGIGSTLFFACRNMKGFKMTENQKLALKNWIETFIH